MSNYTDSYEGFYTATGAATNIVLPFLPSSVEVFIQGSGAGDNWNSVANPGIVKRAWWFNGMAAGTALAVQNTNGAATDQSVFLATGGISAVEVGETTLGPPLTGSGISMANPAVVTITNHGLSTGDSVLLEGTTGMLQVVGFVFQITRTGANTFTIPLNTSGFAAAATAVVARKVIYPDLYKPSAKFVSAITSATSAVVTTTSAHNFLVGERVRLIVPDFFGMSQIDGVAGEVTAITTTTVTLDINSSAFTAFAFPTSGAVASGYTQPQIIPDSITGSSLWPQAVGAAYTSTAFRGFSLGSAVAGPSGALVLWKAYKDLLNA
jgi:hypothetical protein